MTGNLSFGSSFTATNLVDPTNPQDAATKNYVDNAVSGNTWKQAVNVLSSTDIANTPSGGTSPNTPQILTTALTTLSIDSHTISNGYRVLLTGQTNTDENGIFVVSGVGSAIVFTRSSDADTYQELVGASVFVEEGTIYANTGWVQSNHYLTSFTGQAWVQFSGAGAYTGGTGIDITGNVISARLGAGITDLPTGEIGADVVANKAIQLTTLLTGGQLTLVLDEASAGDSGLTQSSAGLKIQAGKVTNAMLTNSSVTTNGDTGTGSLSLGGTLEVKGTSTQGILTTVAGGTFTVTASDASSSQKGVATFDATEFTVTAGNVVLGTIGNSKLANSTITFTGTAGSDAVALGESMAIVGADSMITTTMGANSLSIQLATVDVAHGGTGLTTLAADQLLIGNGTGAVAQSANLTFASNLLTVGGALPLTINGTTGAITATATNSDLVLMPNGTGSVIVGPVGAGLIQSDAGTALTVRGNTTLTLTSGTGDTTMALPSGTGSKVTVSGPTAADYATGLAAEDLVNKQYVDTAIASGAAAGAVKAFQRTVPLNANGTTAIPLTGTMPAGATVLSVKVNVTVADTGATLSVGKTGSVAEYMTTAENDPQTQGLYVAECFVTEASAEGLIATVASSSGSGSGSCVVIVTYQVAQ
jgi:hypothetical protein